MLAITYGEIADIQSQYFLKILIYIKEILVSIQFSFPELCLAAATTLLALGFPTQFWFLASIGILGAIARCAINIQNKKEEAELQKASMDESKKAFADLQNILYRIPAVPDKKDYTTH